jgi:hypothetical protein
LTVRYLYFEFLGHIFFYIETNQEKIAISVLLSPCRASPWPSCR